MAVHAEGPILLNVQTEIFTSMSTGPQVASGPVSSNLSFAHCLEVELIFFLTDLNPQPLQ